MPATPAFPRATADYNIPGYYLAWRKPARPVPSDMADTQFLQVFQDDNCTFSGRGREAFSSRRRETRELWNLVLPSPYDEAGRVPFGLALSTAFGSAWARTWLN